VQEQDHAALADARKRLAPYQPATAETGHWILPDLVPVLLPVLPVSVLLQVLWT
jgi:hypothetical protein